ncbi:guanine-1-methyltransferase-domain-containing protein [Collybia nuda]|uniref:tRNA (guanine(9)-N1)-methyltransferase n=1 Tax=Collybia nuda TaxID=64659 RepID=A0A9P5Y9Y7_9AGAR|nr:guanine-1-methyltransferase-domain-containing protein [Collybia nuda]
MDEPVVPRDTKTGDVSATTEQPLGSESSSTITNSDPPKVPSKSALKKAAKAERLAAVKLERRAKEKEAKKQKKRLMAEKRAAGEIDEDEEERNRHKKRPRIRFGGTVVVDLSFDDKMNEKEISSLCSQLGYTYSANRSAAYPFSLVYTSLNGRTFARLESLSDASYKRWVNTQWWHDGYERLWQDQGNITRDVTNRSVPGDSTRTPVLEVTAIKEIQHNIIYLTADSEEELTELKPEETYIIGGICDHNRYKNLCLNKAKESGIRTARLPIGRYLATLPTRKVLTVNQVFEILLKWIETRDWEEAFNSVIPKRKFQNGGKSRSEDKSATGLKDIGVVELNEERNLDDVDRERTTHTGAERDVPGDGDNEN